MKYNKLGNPITFRRIGLIRGALILVECIALAIRDARRDRKAAK